MRVHRAIVCLAILPLVIPLLLIHYAVKAARFLFDELDEAFEIIGNFIVKSVDSLAGENK